MTEIKRVIALGFFDGIHLGHGALMEMTASRAAALNAQAAAVSFDMHPDTLIKGETVPLISSAQDKKELIGRLYGINELILIHFDEHLMQTPWEEFAVYLRDELHAVHIVVGHDFHFGYRGEGDAERLRVFCEENGLGFDMIPKVEMDGRVISSTYIRSLLLDGEIERANAFLGHPHSLSGIVESGFQLGRTIGIPTTNLRFAPGVLEPRHGVYVTKTFFDGLEYMAVTNVGVRPTVGGKDAVTVESHILDFSGDLYGKTIRVEFYSFLRPEKKFDSVDELRDQISKRDAQRVRDYFAKQ